MYTIACTIAYSLAFKVAGLFIFKNFRMPQNISMPKPSNVMATVGGFIGLCMGLYMDISIIDTITSNN